jgi:RNA polymerase sigma-70 factor (ECF subfamily)
MTTTSASLLKQLHSPGPGRAWDEFVALYTPLLNSWSHRLGFASHDAADVVQDFFLLLLRKLPEFHYDPHQRFRAWLWTLFLNLCREKRRRHSPVAEPLTEAAEPAVPDPAEECDAADYQRCVMARALELMEAEFHPSTWKACWAVVVEGKSAAVVAAELHLTPNAVYVAKGRVLRRLREKLQGLLD